MPFSSCSNLSTPSPLPPFPSFLLSHLSFSPSRHTKSTSLLSFWPFSFLLMSLWHTNSHHSVNPFWLFPSLGGWVTSKPLLTRLHPCRSVANKTYLITRSPLYSVSYHDWGFLDFMLFSVASRTFCSMNTCLFATLHFLRLYPHSQHHNAPVPSESQGEFSQTSKLLVVGIIHLSHTGPLCSGMA